MAETLLPVQGAQVPSLVGELAPTHCNYRSRTSPALAGGFFTTVPPGKPQFCSKHIHVHSLLPASQSFYPQGFISPRIVRKLGLKEMELWHCWWGEAPWVGLSPEPVHLPQHPSRIITHGRRHGEWEDAIQHCGCLFLFLSPPPSLQPEEGSRGKVQPGLRVPEWGGLHGPAVDHPVWVPRWGTCSRWGWDSAAWERGCNLMPAGSKSHF